MWLPAAVCLSCLLWGGGLAQSSATLRRGNDQNGRCHYTFTVPSPEEGTCPSPPGQEGALQRQELDGLKTRMALLEALASRWAGGSEEGARGQRGLQAAYSQALQEKRELQRARDGLDRQVQELQRALDALRRENEKLQAGECAPQAATLQDSGQRPPSGSNLLSSLVAQPRGSSESPSGVRDPAWHFSVPRYQEFKAEVTEVPASRLLPAGSGPGPAPAEGDTGCGELVWVGEPKTHRKADSIAGKYGVWMKDPFPAAPYGPETVWRVDTVGSEVRQLFGYEDEEQLARGFPTKVLLLPEPVESTGAALYRGSLYYQRRRSRTLLRYDLATESVAARRELPHAGFHGQYPYSWGGYTDIDLAADEKGLWAIYSTSKARGAIVISRLDPNTLEVQRSWETNIHKQSVANAFMICGTLYTINSYTSPDTTVNYSFNTESGLSKPVAVPFRNRYRYNSMVDYNPTSRKLYAWDNFHMVSYEVRLESH
ncbi:myocilin [Lepisosteus oculatus]|uniref:myocilin n=1 Tax=Lepisosteus oculatus TaxID=7918 RepID=UPI0037202865